MCARMPMFRNLALGALLSKWANSWIKRTRRSAPKEQPRTRVNVIPRSSVYCSTHLLGARQSRQSITPPRQQIRTAFIFMVLYRTPHCLLECKGFSTKEGKKTVSGDRAYSRQAAAHTKKTSSRRCETQQIHHPLTYARSFARSLTRTQYPRSRRIACYGAPAVPPGGCTQRPAHHTSACAHCFGFVFDEGLVFFCSSGSSR